MSQHSYQLVFMLNEPIQIGPSWAVAIVLCPSKLPSHSDHTSGNQFLNLQTDMGVLHVLLEGSRVATGLLQDALHDRILENGHDLGM